MWTLHGLCWGCGHTVVHAPVASYHGIPLSSVHGCLESMGQKSWVATPGMQYDRLVLGV